MIKVFLILLLSTLFISQVVAGERSLIWTLQPENPQKQIQIKEAGEILEKTNEGSSIISRLGGWQKISAIANFEFGNFDVEKIGGAVLPLSETARTNTGKSYTVMLAEYLLYEPSEAVAVVLAHELSHLEDLALGNYASNETKAYKIQDLAYKEIKSNLSQERLQELENKSKAWKRFGG